MEKEDYRGERVTYTATDELLMRELMATWPKREQHETGVRYKHKWTVNDGRAFTKKLDKRRAANRAARKAPRR